MQSSYWQTGSALERYPRLSGNLEVDVVVIGGGITGITSAYLLQKAGKRVALLERGRLAGVDTGHTTAHLTCAIDTPLTKLVKDFGDDHAQAVWDAGLAAMDQVAECVETERIDCGFDWVPAYLHAPIDHGVRSEDVSGLMAEAETAARLGFDARFVDHVPVANQPGMELDGQARFHVLEYLDGLVAAAVREGCQIFEHAAADDVEDEPLAVVSGDHRIRCGHVVVATHNPIVGKASLVGATLLQTKLALYTSYAVAGRTKPGLVTDALYWDTATPYRYLRVDRRGHHDIVILGGEDHKTGQVDDTTDRFEVLTAALRQLAPGIEIAERWSGQVIETADGLAFIGEMAPRQFAATGFAGNGMTFGTLAGMMARDYVDGRANPWAGLFDLGRTRVRAGLWNYLKENKDYPYYMIRDRLAGPEGRSLRDVPRGSGRIIQLKGERVAAYRRANGSVVIRSPTCTHMGCEVRWNDAERTWDCPCHGSRFAPSGGVISGPAEAPLSEIEPKRA